MSVKIILIAIIVSFVKLSNSWLSLDIQNLSEGYNYEIFRESYGGDPLILTPYLQSKNFSSAREKSFVLPFIAGVKSYAGFFTVNEEYNSNMFFWYFPAEESAKEAPVVLWLQGGPGASSIYGMFLEIGPYMVIEGTYLQTKESYWSKTMHVLFIDNPVATGFSFTESEEGYSTNMKMIGENLYSAVVQFFLLFSELENNNFFIAGESYAGKYVPALGIQIHQRNPQASLKINLKGIVLGSGFVDPYYQTDYGDYLLQIGLIDKKQKVEFHKVHDGIKKAIMREDWHDAFTCIIKEIGGKNSLFRKHSGFKNGFNYMRSGKFSDDKSVDSFLEYRWVREALHVGNLKFRSVSKTTDVFHKLKDDFPKSSTHWLSTLADNYNVVLYNGQLDIIVGYPMTANYVENLKWCGAKEFLAAERSQLLVDNQLAGYMVRSAPVHCNGSLTLIMIRDAGHMTPSDQPHWTYNIVNFFVSLKPFS